MSAVNYGKQTHTFYKSQIKLEMFAHKTQITENVLFASVV